MTADHEHPKAEPVEHEFELWQDGLPVASAASTNREKALREVEHYAAVYGQDGPCEIMEVSRMPVGGPHPEGGVVERLAWALELVLPLAKGYAPAGQTDSAKRSCRETIETAEQVLASLAPRAEAAADQPRPEDGLSDETELHGDLETSIRADAAFISAALSWYDGGPSSDDVRGAWSRLCNALASRPQEVVPATEIKRLIARTKTAEAQVSLALGLISEAVANYDDGRSSLDLEADWIARAREALTALRGKGEDI